MNTQADQSQLYIQLLVGGGIISREELTDFKTIAKDLNMPLIQAIMSSGSLEKEAMNLAGDALTRVSSKQLSADMAIRALRIAVKNKIGMVDAVNKVKSVHRTTRVFVSAANDLTIILVDAGVITREQLGPILVKSSDYATMVGQLMVLEGLVSIQVLIDALKAIVLIRESGLDKGNAVKALQYAAGQSITIEQAMFELGTFVQPDAKTTKVGELFLMAAIICKEDFAECLEIALFKGKDFGEVLEERGLATRQHMKAAKNLLSSIGAEVVKPYEAALCLNRICRHGEKLYTAITDIHKQRQVGFGTRLGELLVRAGLIAQEEIEKIVDCGAGSSIRLGSALLNTGLISEGELYAALRLQSSVRLGYLEATRAVEILDYLRLNQVSLDKAMVELHVYVPSRMQWAWV